MKYYIVWYLNSNHEKEVHYVAFSKDKARLFCDIYIKYDYTVTERISNLDGMLLSE